MKEPIFLRAGEGDVDDLAHIAYTSGLKKTMEKAIATCLDEIARKDEFWIMRDGEGKSLGYVSGRREGDRENGCYELYHIGVNGDYKGGGIGKKIFLNFEKEVKNLYEDHGEVLRKIRLKTGEGNIVAHSFYEKMGMQKVAELPHHFRDQKTEYVYEKYYNQGKENA